MSYGQPNRSRTRLILAGVFTLALVLRVVYVLQMRANPYFDDPQVDQLFYVQWGRALAHGQSIGPGPLPRAPLYAWWLAGIFSLTHESLLAARLLQSIAGSTVIVLIYLIARRAFDARVALVSALFGATYWVTIYYQGELLRESLCDLLNLLSIWTVMRAADDRRIRSLVISGLCCGASALLRPQILPFVAALAVWIAWMWRARASTGVGTGSRFLKRGYKAALLFLACACATILPCTLYNLVRGDDLVLISPEGGQALWIGNHPGADGVDAVAPGMRRDWNGNNEDGRILAEGEEGRSLKPSEVSRHYLRRTLDAFGAKPFESIALLARKVELACSNWEFGGNPEEPRFFADRFAPIVRWLPLDFAVVLALAALGLFMSARRGWILFPLWGFLGIYFATVVFFLASSRHRIPLLPILIIYAGVGVVWSIDALRAGRLRHFSVAALAVVLIALGSRSLPAPREASQANGLWWLGIAEARAGRSQEAMRFFEQSIAAWPHFCYVYTSLGIVQRAVGETEAAAVSLREALRRCPDDVQALDSMSDIELSKGNAAEALALARRSIAAAPQLARSRYNLGRALVAEKDLAHAAEAFRAALERDSTYFNAAYGLGMVELDLAHDREATEALTQAVRLCDSASPEFVFKAHEELVALLVKQNRMDEARAFARALLARMPNDARARAILDRL